MNQIRKPDDLIIWCNGFVVHASKRQAYNGDCTKREKTKEYTLKQLDRQPETHGLIPFSGNGIKMW